MKVLFVLLSVYATLTFSARILSVYHYPIKSHYSFASPLLIRLAERGHEVTVYTHYPKPKNHPIVANYVEFDISMCFRSSDSCEMDVMMAEFGDSLVRTALNFPLMAALTIESIEQCQPLMQLLNSTEKYDLFITESFDSDCMLMFANKFNVPFITTTPNVLTPYQAARLANAGNPSYVPTFGVVTALGYLSSMNFQQRVVNTVSYVVVNLLYHTVTMRKETDVIRHFLGPSAPSLYETVKNTSLIISNSDVNLNFAFPMVPSVIQAPGMYISAAKALPKVRI